MIKKLKTFWNKLGPGLITGVSDDDPSGIVTYTQAGARFGFGFLWTAWLTYPLMYAVQEMCARIGIKCSCGIAGVLKQNYSKWILYTLIVFIYPAIVINIAADLNGMSAVGNMLVPSIHIQVFNWLFAIVILIGIVFFTYRQISTILKYLCLFLLAYFFVPFLVKIEWKSVILASFFPQFEWSKEYLTLLVAVLGTTISPYLFLWQSTSSVEQKNHHNRTESQELEIQKFDVKIGMFVSNLAMFFIILTAGAVLHKGGINNIETVEQAAKALKPLSNEYAYFLFSFGVLGLGALSIPVLAGCTGYLFAETFDLPLGLDKKINEAKLFYFVISFTMIVSAAINFLGINPIKFLIFAALLYGLIAPVLIALILHIGNNKKIMGKNVNSLWINILGFAALVLMSFAAVALVFF